MLLAEPKLPLYQSQVTTTPPQPPHPAAAASSLLPSLPPTPGSGVTRALAAAVGEEGEEDCEAQELDTLMSASNHDRASGGSGVSGGVVANGGIAMASGAPQAAREREKDLEQQRLPPLKPGELAGRRDSLAMSSTTPRPTHLGVSSPQAKFFYIILNTFSTIITVFLNKITFSDPQFRKLQISIAIWHFVTTFLIILAAGLRPFNLYRPIRLPLRDVMPICVLFTLFLLFNNLSLTTNPVGFYQLAKILTTPALVTLDFAIFGKRITWTRLASVLISCLGVALTNGASARSNPLGAAIAVAAFIVTALYQIWIGKTIHELSVSGVQLLLNQAPIAALMLLPFVPFLDTMPNLKTVPPTIIWSFVGSGLAASMINLSQFLIIEGTSALTFNIVGLVKTIVIVAFGWYQEGKGLTIQDLVGVVFALGGAWWYARIGAAAGKGE